MYEKSKPEDFNFIVYRNKYDIYNLRLALASSLATTTFATVLAAFVNPLFCGLLAYDWYLVFRQMRIMNQTVEMLVLKSCKTKVDINKYNFAGFFREIKFFNEKKINKLFFNGIIENKYLRANEIGLLPSMFRLMRMRQDP